MIRYLKMISGVLLLPLLFVIDGSAAPTPEVLVTDVISSHIAVQDDYLIWSEYNSIPICKMPKNGGPISGLAYLVGTPMNLMTYDGNIFWIGRWGMQYPSDGDTRILIKTSLDGTTSTALALGRQYINGGRVSADIAIYEDSVYWVTSINGVFSINKVLINGGGSTTLLSTSKPITSLARDGSNLYWVEWADDGYDRGTIKKMALQGGEPSIVYSADTMTVWDLMAVSGSEIVFRGGDLVNGQWGLMKISSSGGEPTFLITLTDKSGEPSNIPGRIIIVDNNVYWTDQHSINTIPLNGGEHLVLVDNLSSPQDLAVVGGSLYWTENKFYQNPGCIKKIAVTGGLVTILTESADLPLRLAIDGSDIYLAEGYENSRCRYPYADGRIARMPIGGGAIQTLVSGIANILPDWKGIVQTAPFAVDNTNVYVADGCSVKKIPLAGGAVERIASFPDYPIVSISTDGEFLYSLDYDSTVWKIPVAGGEAYALSPADSDSEPGPIHVVNNTVYWASSDTTIKKMDKNGGDVVTFGLPFLSDFVVDDKAIYFSGQDTGEIRWLPADGGVPRYLAYGLKWSWNILALDQDNVYWINQINIGTVPKKGGKATIIGDLQNLSDLPSGIAVDNNNLYWAETGTGTIKKMNLKIPATILVVFPNGGETFTAGSTQTLYWNYDGDLGSYVKVELLKGGVVNQTVNGFTPVGIGGTGVYKWTIPPDQNSGTDYRIRVTSTSNDTYTDTSDSDFTIAAPITVVSPNGGESLTGGSIQTIRWSYEGNPGAFVKIELLKNGVVNRTIAAFVPNGRGGTGSHNWTIPINQAPGTDYRIRVTSTSNSAYTDTSDGDFSISAPTITVVSPNGGETLTAGAMQTIRWSYTGNPGLYIKIQLLKGGVVKRTIASFASKGSGGSGSHNWHIPSNQVPGNDYQIRVISTSNNSYSDTSDSNFTISK
ncbi:MAG TPA: Ser-Thr-rich GPI-anchored membrane family protein [Thermodesulfobacteriota bacterium]|nr:Ser-Thr-rich GPI-anchored membrane family protein [Thermodesulfobacteriota bacterium]